MHTKSFSLWPTLRPYQQEGIADIDAYIQDGYKRILRQNFTGTGKSVEQLYLCVRHLEEDPKNIVLFLVPTEELIENLAKYLLDNNIKVSYIKSGRSTLFSNRVFIASVATLVKRLEILNINPTLIIADECHHSPSNSWKECLSYWEEAIKIGMSATPERLDGKPFTDLFDVMVYGKNYSYYIENGYLAPFKVAIAEKLANIFRKLRGEYDLREQQDLLSTPTIIGNAVDKWVEHCLGLKTITFCSGIEHSKSVSEAYNEFGKRHYGRDIAAHLDGTTGKNKDEDKNLRRKILERFRLPVEDPESLLIICNVSILIEGVNVPDASVTQWLRLTASEVLFDQGNGRSNRYQPGKTQIILDHVGNVAIHGLPNRMRYYDLDGRKKREDLKKYWIICNTCEHLITQDYRKLDRKIFKDWLPCPNCGSGVILPNYQKQERLGRSGPDLEDGELVFLEEENLKSVNLMALAQKYEKYNDKTFLKKLKTFQYLSLEDLKFLVSLRRLPESYAMSIFSSRV